ncbi:uncharacterized protein LOC121404511 [Drosophila obscura]|uniref:uncharacterized protein LOC121404511 n=1 Tax=Drosophila obscura TaxID=7282 RepID=UPI001BB10958|nr:uncharacterized protein LOC121404511 [Drosophila obscura]
MTMTPSHPDPPSGSNAEWGGFVRFVCVHNVAAGPTADLISENLGNFLIAFGLHVPKLLHKRTNDQCKKLHSMDHHSTKRYKGINLLGLFPHFDFYTSGLRRTTKS